VGAAFSGQSDIALGNVVGSNLFNVLVILGLSALAAPLIARRQLLRRDVPVMVGATLLGAAFAYNGTIGRVEGVMLLAGLVLYVSWSIRQGRRDSTPHETAEPPVAGSGSWLRQLLLIGLGVGTLVLGTRWVVGSSVELARILGVSELIIGLTVIAAGTSLPELVTSVMAALRGHRDLAVGNVIGSNTFNILAILGASSLVQPIAVAPEAISFDIPVMVAVAVLCAFLLTTASLLTRAEGLLLIGLYAAYTIYLVLHGMDHPALDSYSAWVQILGLVSAAALAVFAAARLLLRSWGRRRDATGQTERALHRGVAQRPRILVLPRRIERLTKYPLRLLARRDEGRIALTRRAGAR
jgi:cation:H+ antiporter